MDGLAGMMGMMGMGRATEAASEYPEEYAMLQGDRTKQMLAQLLLARGMQQQPPGQMAGRFYVPNSPLQGIAGLAQAGAGAYLMNANDQKRMEMAKALQARQQGEVEKFQKQLAPQQGQVTIDATRAEMPDTWDVDALQGGPQVGTQPLPNDPRAHVANAVPLVDRGGMQPTSQTMPVEVPRSKEEVKQILTEAMMKTNPRVREAAKFMAQQQQAEEQKALDRENRLENTKLGFSRDLLMAGAMGVKGKELEDLKAAHALEVKKLEQAGQDRRDNVQGSVVADAKSPTGYSYADLRTGKIVMPGAPVPSSAVQQEKNQGIKMKSLPGSVGQKFMENSQNLRMAERAMALVEGKNVEGMTGDPDATGLKGYLPDSILQRVDPKGVDTRAAVANLGSMIIHDRSGAAVTAAEYPRLRPFIPKANDDAATTTKKLNQFVQEYQKINEEMTDFYSEAGYDVPKGNWHRSPQAESAPSSGKAEKIINFWDLK